MYSSDFKATARERLNGKWGKAICFLLALFAITIVLVFLELLFKKDESIQSIISLVAAIIELPLFFGLMIALYKLYKDEYVVAFDFISFGIANFKKAFSIAFHTSLKLILPVVLEIISFFLIGIGSLGGLFSIIHAQKSGIGSLFFIGYILFIIANIWLITKSYYYQLAFIIAADDEYISGAEAVAKSEDLMRGNRLKLFSLHLSISAWLIPALLLYYLSLNLKSHFGVIISIMIIAVESIWLMPYVLFATFSFYEYLRGDNINVISNDNEFLQDSEDNTNDNNENL